MAAGIIRLNPFRFPDHAMFTLWGEVSYWSVALPTEETLTKTKEQESLALVTIILLGSHR